MINAQFVFFHQKEKFWVQKKETVQMLFKSQYFREFVTNEYKKYGPILFYRLYEGMATLFFNEVIERSN